MNCGHHLVPASFLLEKLRKVAWPHKNCIVGDYDMCVWLDRSLDLSFNNIRVIGGLSGLVKLEKLFLINNKLKKIEQLEQLTCLTMLELGDNRIRVSCSIGSWDMLCILTNQNFQIPPFLVVLAISKDIIPLYLSAELRLKWITIPFLALSHN